MPKYKKEIVVNSDEIYNEVFDSKNVEFIRQHRTKTFQNFQGVKFKARSHIWTTGDTLFRLSSKYFGNLNDWWIIGLVNGKPTDAHYELGDIVYIPLNPTVIRNKI
jgi:hypothetical protein